MAEATGLVSAIGYAEAVAAAHAAHGTTETFTNALTLAGYGQAVVDAVTAARHASATAAAAWSAAAAELGTALTVRDAYAAVPDAGGKRHLTTDPTTDPATGGARSTVAGSAAGRAGAAATTGRTAEMSHLGARRPAAVAAPSARRKDGADDPLQVSARIVLGDGEQFVASGSAADDCGMLVLAAAVDTPDGRVVHIGPVDAEDKTRWKGAYAPATETEPDEEFPDDLAEAHTVHTWSDTTVVIDAAAAARLPRNVDELIEVAAEIDTDYKETAARYVELDDERERLQAKRFADPADVERKAEVDHRRDHHAKYQPYRRKHMDACRDRLPADAQALFEALQQQIDAAGRDAFDPDREDLAAAVSGLTVDEYRELYELQKIPYRTRTPEQEQRVDALDGHDRKPPLLAEQAALVYGLTLAEYREMEDLYRVGRHGTRTAEQTARYEQLRGGTSRGATFATPEKTRSARSAFDTYQAAHHDAKMEWARNLEEAAELEAKARPLPPADAARLAELTAECDVLGRQVDELAGSTVTVDVPGRNGATLVIQAAQRDEYGGVDFLVDCRPAGASADWSPGEDSYRTTADGAREVANLAASLAATESP